MYIYIYVYSMHFFWSTQHVLLFILGSNSEYNPSYFKLVIVLSDDSFKNTLPNTNIAPENEWFPIGFSGIPGFRGLFFRGYVSFQGGFIYFLMA